LPQRLPIHRLHEFASLTPGEVERIRALAEPSVRLPRHTILRREGEPPQAIWLLVDGWVAASMLLPDGERQILKLHLPGDMLGTASMSLTQAADTLTALTAVTVSRVPALAFGQLFMDSPRFAACMVLTAQRERVALMDRLAVVGRTSAVQRLAALLLDLRERLTMAGGAAADTFELPVTQEQIGDYLGLTGVHVNRMIRQLESDGVIARHRQRLTISQPAKLRQIAGTQERELARDPAWLTAVPPDA
jgi:CRP-like cAMP-binding protein